MPNGVGETSLEPASAAEATPTAITATTIADRPRHRVTLTPVRILMAPPSSVLADSHRGWLHALNRTVLGQPEQDRDGPHQTIGADVRLTRRAAARPLISWGRRPDRGQDLMRRPVSALHAAFEIALRECRGVLAGEVDAALGQAEVSPVPGVLAGQERRVGAVHPRVACPHVKPGQAVESAPDPRHATAERGQV